MKNKKTILILFFSLMAITIICKINLGSDYFWHLKMGEYIINFKSLPKECIYSWFAIENNLMFTLHEWGYEIIIYFLYLFFNNFTPYIYIIIFITLTTMFLYKTLIKILLNKNIIQFISFITLATYNLSMYSIPRPHIISWMLIAITVYLSYDLYYNESKKIYLMPIITLLWVNIHGGSSCLSYMIPGLFMVIGMFNFNKLFIINKKLSREKITDYFIIIILNILTLLINPYGIKMVLYPFINILDNTMTSAIYEWKAPKITSLLGIIAYLHIFYNILIFYKSKKKLKLIDISLFLVFVYLAMSSYRFIPLLTIISFYTTLPYFLNNDQHIKGNAIIIFLIIANMLVLISQIKSLKNNLNYKEISDNLINTIYKIKPKRLYNDYNIGGYLIYKEIPVFIDGRADAYSKCNLMDTVKLISANKEEIQEIINKYNFDVFITLSNSNLQNYLSKNKQYKFVIADKHYSIYQKIKN